MSRLPLLVVFVSLLVCIPLHATYYRLTYGPGEKGFPSWSPDGTKIAYQSAQNGQWDIYTVPAQGGTPTRITNNPADDENPMWTPDGSKISFVSFRQGWAIWVHDLATGQETMLMQYASCHCWSPDGSKIVYSKYVDGYNNLYVLNINTGIETKLTYNSNTTAWPDWSHDGQSIVYNLGDVNPTVWVIPAQGGTPTQILSGAYFPKWHPSDNKIAFWSGTDQNTYGLWVYDLQKQHLTQITYTLPPTGCYDPAWSPDGTTITFCSAMEDPTSHGDIWVTDSYVYPTAFHIQFEIRSLGKIKAVFH